MFSPKAVRRRPSRALRFDLFQHWVLNLFGSEQQIRSVLGSAEAWLASGRLKRIRRPLLSLTRSCLWNKAGKISSCLLWICLENLSRTCFGRRLGHRRSSVGSPVLFVGLTVFFPLPLRVWTHWMCPKKSATWMAEWPAWFVWSSRKPSFLNARTRNSKIWLCPPHVAYIRALFPHVSVSSGSALNFTRSFTVSKCPCSHARLKAVRPWSSRAFTSAPFSRSNWVNWIWLCALEGTRRASEACAHFRLSRWWCAHPTHPGRTEPSGLSRSAWLPGKFWCQIPDTSPSASASWSGVSSWWLLAGSSEFLSLVWETVCVFIPQRSARPSPVATETAIRERRCCYGSIHNHLLFSQPGEEREALIRWQELLSGKNTGLFYSPVRLDIKGSVAQATALMAFSLGV